MSSRPTAAEREAATWVARLSRPLVSQRDLAELRIWREQDGNDEAFRRVQESRRRLGRLAGDADLDRALGEARRRKPVRWPVWTTPVAALSMGCAVLAVMMGTRSRLDLYATALGESSLVRLADGSTAQLDTSTRLRVSFTSSERRLELLDGQALFTVAHDVRRPFRVVAGEREVVATGTRFDVRRDARSAEVVLLDGRVRIADRTKSGGHPVGGSGLTLKPGEVLGPGATRPRIIGDATAATAWTRGQLVFQDLPLPAAVAEANRYSRRRIALAPGMEWSTIHVSGVFTAGDTLALAQALQSLHGLDAEQSADGGVVLIPARVGARGGG